MDTLIAYIVVIGGTSWWVYLDAKYIGVKKGLIPGLFDLSPLTWAVACLGLWIIAFPAYIIIRPQLKTAVARQQGKAIDTSDDGQTGLNTAAKYIAVGWTFFSVAMLITVILGMGANAPDLDNEYVAAGFAIGATMGVSIWFWVWAVIAIPAALIFLVTRRQAPAPPQQQVIPEAEGKTQKCPFCAENIKLEAVFCRFCKNEIKSTNKPEKKISLFDKGKELIKAGEYKEAILTFSTAIKESPSAEGYYLRAITYSKIQDREKTITDLKAAADLGHEKANAALEKIGH